MEKWMGDSTSGNEVRYGKGRRLFASCTDRHGRLARVLDLDGAAEATSGRHVECVVW